jgi:hypothetical protein
MVTDLLFPSSPAQAAKAPQRFVPSERFAGTVAVPFDGSRAARRNHRHNLFALQRVVQLPFVVSAVAVQLGNWRIDLSQHLWNQIGIVALFAREAFGNDLLRCGVHG